MIAGRNLFEPVNAMAAMLILRAHVTQGQVYGKILLVLLCQALRVEIRCAMTWREKHVRLVQRIAERVTWNLTAVIISVRSGRIAKLVQTIAAHVQMILYVVMLDVMVEKPAPLAPKTAGTVHHQILYVVTRSVTEMRLVGRALEIAVNARAQIIKYATQTMYASIIVQ